MDDTPRELFLCEEVEGDNIRDLIKEILNINKRDKECAENLKDYKREPISLYINTCGGSVYDGLALMNAMNISKTPINTIAIGSVMSMGLPIYLSGDKRYTTEYATFMYHDIAGDMGGKLSHIKERSEEWERIRAVCNQVVCKNTSITKADIEDMLDRKLDIYVDSEEALKLGIASEWLSNL